MRKNIEKVINAFRAGKPAIGDSKRTCWTDGKTLFSYRMPIARHAKHANRGRIVLVRYSAAPTVTTRAQIRACEESFPNAVRVGAIDKGYVFRSLAGESGYQDRPVKVRASAPDVTRENYIDAAQGLYWFAADYHGGQGSRLYSILSTLGYCPGASESGPDESGQEFYAALEAGADAEVMFTAIKRFSEAR